MRVEGASPLHTSRVPSDSLGLSPSLPPHTVGNNLAWRSHIVTIDLSLSNPVIIVNIQGFHSEALMESSSVMDLDHPFIDPMYWNHSVGEWLKRILNEYFNNT